MKMFQRKVLDLNENYTVIQSFVCKAKNSFC